MPPQRRSIKSEKSLCHGLIRVGRWIIFRNLAPGEWDSRVLPLKVDYLFLNVTLPKYHGTLRKQRDAK